MGKWKHIRLLLVSERGPRRLWLAAAAFVMAALISALPGPSWHSVETSIRLAGEAWPTLVLLIAAVVIAAVALRIRGVRRKGLKRREAPELPLFVHVALLLIVATGLALALGALLWTAVGQPPLNAAGVPKEAPLPAPTRPAAGWTVGNTFDAMKIVLSIVAGIGGVVALTVAYRRQYLGETAEFREEAKESRENTKLHNERFVKAAELLGSYQAAVRLAGVYATAALADDWRDGRQTCIDVLCAYLRMPYTPPADADESNSGISTTHRIPDLLAGCWRSARPGVRLDTDEWRARRQERQVRHTVIRVIKDHVRPLIYGQKSWYEQNFDFTGAVFDGADFNGARFSGNVRFSGAQFYGVVDFSEAQFVGSVDFSRARFPSGAVSFFRARFNAHVRFDEAHFCGSTVDFRETDIVLGSIDFRSAHFASGTVDLSQPGNWLRWPDFDAWPTGPPAALRLPPGGATSDNPEVRPSWTPGRSLTGDYLAQMHVKRVEELYENDKYSPNR